MSESWEPHDYEQSLTKLFLMVIELNVFKISEENQATNIKINTNIRGKPTDKHKDKYKYSLKHIRRKLNTFREIRSDNIRSIQTTFITTFRGNRRRFRSMIN